MPVPGASGHPSRVGRIGSPTGPILNTQQPAGVLQPSVATGTIEQTFVKIEDPNPLENSRIITIPSQPATVYNDSGSGTITLSGTAAEAFSTPPIEPLRATQAVELEPIRLGSRSFRPSAAYFDSASGTITLSGTASDSFQVVPPKVYSVTAVETVPIRLGSRFYIYTAATVYNDSASGTITLSGTAVESFATPPREALAAVAAVELAPRLLGSRIIPGVAAAQTFNDSGSGTITLTGSALESFFGPQPRVVEPVVQPSTEDRREESQNLQAATSPGTGGYATTPVTAYVQRQGQTQSTVAGVPQPDDLNPQGPVPKTFFYYNAAPPIYRVIVPGSTNQFYSTTPVPQLEVQTPPSRVIVAPQAFVYNDSASGTITLSGTSSESFSTPPRRQPFRASAAVEGEPSRLGSRIYTVASATTYNDSASGTITLSGTALESFSTAGFRGAIRATAAHEPVQRILGPRAYGIFLTNTHSDFASGSIIIGGSAFDNYVPPGGGGQVQNDPNYFIVIHP